MEAFWKSIFQAKGSALDFNMGFISAIAVILAILLFLLILRLVIAFVFRTKRCHGVTINGENGDIFISSAAITSLIRSLENDFKFVAIDKVRLYTRNRQQFLNIQIDFDASGGGLPPQSADLQLRVLATLKETFGIESISKVHITLRNITISESHPRVDFPVSV
ncbi:MAG: alkaline shock response membrane anchor protein AmaP [Victivallaceae bacterium]